MGSISSNGGTIYIKDFGGQVKYSYTDQVGSYINNVVFPCMIINATPGTDFVKVIFKSNITLNNDPQNYFICGSNRIQFGSENLNSDGTVPVITISGVTNYPGLIQNGTNASDEKSSIYIFNIYVDGVSSPSTLEDGGGWIGQKYFGGSSSTDCLIINCMVSGDISTNGGGIIGQFSKNTIIDTCISYQNISQFAGGIAGADCNNLTIRRCRSNGGIGDSGGGILGDNSESCTIIKSFASGLISLKGGGIVGENADSINVIDSYSTGKIGDNAGGIFGSNARTCSATNCYSTGEIGVNAGGIFGISYDVTCSASSCYTSGFNPLLSSGGIFSGSNSDGTSNYSEANHDNNGSWSDTNASANLNGITGNNIGSRVWFSVDGFNTPYRTFVGCSPYRLDNIDVVEKTIRSYTDFSITPGGSTTGILVGTIDYSSSNVFQSPLSNTITINTSTGVISTTSNTPPDNYTLVIYSTTMVSFLLTTVSINVSSSSGQNNGSVYNNFARSIGSAPSLITSARASFSIAASQSGKPLKFNSYEGYLKYKKAINDRS